MSEKRKIMSFVWSAKDELIRCFIDYLFEETDVIITENLEIPLDGETLRLFANEERKLPRWLAIWLARKGYAKILTEKNPDELLGKLKSFELKQRSRASLVSIPRDFIIELKRLSEKETDPTLRNKILDRLTELLRIRAMKLFGAASTAVLKHQELPLIEDVFYNFARQLIENWLDALKEISFEELLKEILLEE